MEVYIRWWYCLRSLLYMIEQKAPASLGLVSRVSEWTRWSLFQEPLLFARGCYFNQRVVSPPPTTRQGEACVLALRVDRGGWRLERSPENRWSVGSGRVSPAKRACRLSSLAANSVILGVPWVLFRHAGASRKPLLWETEVVVRVIWVAT